MTTRILHGGVFASHRAFISFSLSAYTSAKTLRRVHISGRGSSRRVSRRVSGRDRCSGMCHPAGEGRVYHRAEEHPPPGQKLGVDRFVVFHHPPDRCGIGHPRPVRRRQHPGQPLCHRVPHRPEGRQPLHGHVLRLCRRQERPEGHLSLKSQNNFQNPEQKMPAPGFLCDLLTEKRRSLGYTVLVR